MVLPAGTYRLAGTITDSGIGLAGVAVTVDEPELGKLECSTNGGGRYVLYGVRGRVRLHAARSGYLNEVLELDVADHQTVDFEMRLDRPRTDLRGTYMLTVRRMGCPDSPLPETRSYEATVAQDGPRLTVSLSGAEFIVAGAHGNGFSGGFDGLGRVTFFLGTGNDYSYGYETPYNVVERFSETSALIISGSVSASVSPTGIAGTVRGQFGLFHGVVAPFTALQFGCWSAGHSFEMVRR